MSDIIAFVVLITIVLVKAVSMYFLFEKAGEKGWKALVPVYALWVLIKIIGRPKWWIVMFLIPVLGWLYAIGAAIDLLKSFGQNKARHILFLVVGGIVYLPYLAFSKKVVYVGPAATFPKVERSTATEWGEAIIFAVLAATIIRWAFMEAFTIPTPSMENSLLMGDYLFVSKFHYGARTPKTPLQVPLTHQYIWGTKIPSYVEWLQLPQYRLPGISKIKNNDVVVFNWPADDEYPTDLKMNYIKRCMGIAGDTLRVVNKQVYINGKPASNAPEMQFSYLVYTNEMYPERIFRKYKIPNYKSENGDFTVKYGEIAPGKSGYMMHLTESKVAQMMADKMADSIKIINNDVPFTQLFPYTKQSAEWTIDNYGPLWIPKKGVTVKADSSFVSTYEMIISKYEGWETVENKGGRLIIEGKEVSEYTFKQDYYFMMGDNRHNSSDSRFWGFVPEDHVVGKAFMIWMSVDAEGGWSDGIRWKRIFNFIE